MKERTLFVTMGTGAMIHFGTKHGNGVSGPHELREKE